MDELLKTTERKEIVEKISLKNYFFPLTNAKAIMWIISVGLIVYGNSLFNGFVLDDLFQVVNNENIKNTFYFFTHEIGPYYRPIMMATFSVIYQMVGSQPFLYHLWQVVIYIGNAVLFYLFFSTFFRNKYLVFSLALIFLVHPINAETVNYISVLQDAYFVFFGLLSLVIVRKTKHTTKLLFSSSILLLLSVLSKETGVLFIFIQLLLVWFYYKKYFWKYFIFIIPVIFIYILLLLSLFGYIINSNDFLFTISNTVTTAPLSQRLINIPNIILYYISTFIFPKNLAVAQFWWNQTITFSHFYLPLMIDLFIFMAIILLGMFLHKRNKSSFVIFLFFLIWFIVGLSFHVQIFKLDQTVAEHWFYFPEIGLLGIIGVTLQEFLVDRKIFKVLIVCSISIITLLSIRTIIRNFNWHDPLTLYIHDIKEEPTDAYLAYNLGLAYADEGDYAQAIPYTRQAINSVPNGYLLWQNLGGEYYKLHDYSNAELSLQKAISMKPDFYGAYIDLANTLLAAGEPNKAKCFIEEKVITQWQNSSYAWRLLGYANYLLKDRQDALNDFQKAYTLDPSQLNEYNYINLQQGQSIEIQL